MQQDVRGAPEVHEVLPLLICVPLPISLGMPDVSTGVADYPVQPVQVNVHFLQLTLTVQSEIERLFAVLGFATHPTCAA